MDLKAINAQIATALRRAAASSAGSVAARTSPRRWTPAEDRQPWSGASRELQRQFALENPNVGLEEPCRDEQASISLRAVQVRNRCAGLRAVMTMQV